MFEINEYINCGNNGVCKIIDTVKKTLSGGRIVDYYQLEPVYENKSTVFAPINNGKIAMRKIMTEGEVSKLIESIPSIEVIEIENDKLCEKKYKEVMQTYEAEAWVKILKTLHLRKKDNSADGKKTTSVDTKYQKLAEEYLVREIAISLDKPKEEVEVLVNTEIKKCK